MQLEIKISNISWSTRILP